VPGLPLRRTASSACSPCAPTRRTSSPRPWTAASAGSGHGRRATAKQDAVGRRPRTVYTITRAGRRALAAWLAEPGAGPALEFEGLVKLIFADHGTRDAALASLARAREWAVEQNVGNIEAGEKFLDAQDGLYAQRGATTLLLGAFLTDYYKLVAEWADWATDEVEGWPKDISSHRISPDRTREVLERARWSEGKQCSPHGTALGTRSATSSGGGARSEQTPASTG
jgi:PadR family transcriptional regulator AphA